MAVFVSPCRNATSPSSPRARFAQAGFIEFLGQRKRLRPGALRQRWVQVLVRLAFDDQHAKPKPLVALNERILKVIAKAFGDFGNGEGRKLTAQPAHFRVEGVPLVAAAR